ncbi:MAG: DM13 domain-containing protein [Salinibacter sp.]|uniref:DM13 domain-containing protein n=1 Tax=Salinibacter sp. TaxID=2065818 RepID=UPI0035D4942E
MTRSANMNAHTVPTLFLALTFALGCGVVGSQGEAETRTENEEARLDTVLAEGSFEGKEGIETSGTYQIGRSGSDLKLVLGEDFQTETGPDLYVVLSPKRPGEATGENVMDGSAVRVDTLSSLTGKQTYDLQDGRDLKPFDSVAIQCIQFSHLYGAAELD